MKNAYFLPPLILLVSLALLAACGDDDAPTETDVASSPTGDPAISPSETAPIVTPRPRTGRECGPGPQAGIGLIANLEFNEEIPQYPPGEEIVMTLVLRNCASNNVSLYYETEARYDFFVEDSTAQEVWRWSDEQDLAEVAGEVTIVPEETVEYSVTWDQRDFGDDLVKSGVYRVSAFSLGCGIEGASNCYFGPVELVEILE